MPRMLASPAIEYVQLPYVLEQLDQAMESLNRLPILSDGAIKEYLQDFGHIKRLGDQLAHTLGNFNAMLRLVEGAYCAGTLSVDDYLTLDEEIGKAIILHPEENDCLAFQELQYFRRLRTAQMQDPQAPSTTPIAEGKKFLLIDDMASLGWAQTLSGLVLGKAPETGAPLSAHFSQLHIDGFTAIGRASPFDESGEREFVSEILRCLKKAKGEELINEADIIFLDLRLQRVSDEGKPPEKQSGILILKTIRDINGGVPIILLTASRKASSLDAVLQEGADEYFVKDPGDAGESSGTVKAYYQDFAEMVQRTLRTTYRREIWKGIATCTDRNEAVPHLKKALACLRRRPTRFEQENLGHSPYAATINELGSAMERYVECDSGKGDSYEEKVRECFQVDPVTTCIARTLGFIRNNAAHPLEQHNIGEADARIAFSMALICMKAATPDIATIAGSTNPYEPSHAMRMVLSYVRKLAAGKSPSVPLCKGPNDLADILGGRGQLSAICSFLLAPTTQWSWKTTKHHPFRILGSVLFERFLQLTNVSPEDHWLKPNYTPTEGTPPRILEAFYDLTERAWKLPNFHEPIAYTSVGHSFPLTGCDDCTQAFIKDENGVWIPWGPLIPFGKYETDHLKQMLTIDSAAASPAHPASP
jgi:CheY-like chemotaxis protein